MPISIKEQKTNLSIVIPVRNEAGNLSVLIQRLNDVIGAMGQSYEYIFVTDINTDNTYKILQEAHKRDKHIKVLKLLNTYGHHVAVYAGLTKVNGKLVIIMDGDLQDCPEDIPILLKRVNDGYDIVYGQKENKNESAIRNMLSRTFLKIMRWLSDYPMDFNTSMFRVVTREVVDTLMEYKEGDPSLTFLMGMMGYRSARVTVASGTRYKGRSNYGLWRQINYAINSLTAFSTKPLRIISSIGLAVSLLSFLYFLVVIGQKVFGGIGVKGWPTIIAVITLLGGLQLLSLGIIGEYMGKVFLEVKKRPLFTIEKYYE